MKLNHLLTCCCLALLACGPSMVGSKFVKSQDVKANQGAVIEVSKSDSSVLNGTKLQVPAGALASDVTITLELGLKDLVNSNAASPVTTWKPDGLHFTTPATLTLPLTIAQGQSTDHLNIQVQEANGTTFRIPRSDLTIVGSSVTFKIDGFTSFQANTQNACMTDSDCSMGEQCVNGGCQGGAGGGAGGGNGGGQGGGNGGGMGGGQGGGSNACQVDTDCPMGEACRNGACTGGGVGGGQGGGMGGGQGGGSNACMTDSDCQMGEQCVNGACTGGGVGGGMGGGQGGGMGGGQGGGDAGIDGGLTCQVDTDCQMGESCVNGYCTVVNYCRQDSDCTMGQLCDVNTGTCYVSGTDGGINDGGIGDGGINDGGMNPDGGISDGGQGDGGVDGGVSCQVDTDCAMPELCVANVCTAIACDMNRPCPGNYACVNNWCQ
ncbi:MAG: hypothetical protein QM723_09840 [Myxococcaceae bacterium]